MLISRDLESVCSDVCSLNNSIPVLYTYRLNQEVLVEGNTTLCNRTVAETHLMGDSASSVEFFVGVAVLAFLYCMLALLVYLGYMHVYKDSNFGPTLVSATSEGFVCLECDQLCNPRFLGMIYDWQVFSPLSLCLSFRLACFASLLCHLPRSTCSATGFCGDCCLRLPLACMLVSLGQRSAGG